MPIRPQPIRQLDQRPRIIVAQLLHDAQSLGPPLTKEDPIALAQKLGTLHKLEGHGGAVARAYVASIDIDNRTRLRHRAHMQHRLIFGADGSGMRKDEDLGDELPINLGLGDGGVFVLCVVMLLLGLGRLREDDHALADFLAADAAQGEGGGLAGGAGGDGDAFALDGADGGGEELAEAVGTDEDGVAGVDDAGFDDAGDDGADVGDGEGVVDVELERGVGVVVAVVRQDVEELADEVETLARDVGHLEDGADALADELGGRVDAVFAALDEDGDFAGAGGLEDLLQLGEGLLEDVGRADVDFGDDDHDGHVEREGDAEVFFGHADEAVVGRDHEQAVVGLGAQETEDGGAQVSLVAGQVGEADDFGAALADFFPAQFPAGHVG